MEEKRVDSVALSRIYQDKMNNTRLLLHDIKLKIEAVLSEQIYPHLKSGHAIVDSWEDDWFVEIDKPWET